MARTRAGAGLAAERGAPGHRCRTTARLPARDRGSVTAELAVVLPGVVLVLVAVLLVGAAAITQLRCADAARAGARAAALGEPAVMVTALAADLAGAGARVRVSEEDGWVVVEVSQAVETGPLGGVGWRASATASAWPEPGAP